uniref:Amidase n=1 Tax=Solibacter usitatus (strain Ellin6076) TaxID=234267 RepID=Q01RZ7_SOLUE
MDRRTWLQLITILTAAREAYPQQRGGTTPPPDAAGRGGRGGRGGFQDQPMRVTKEQVTGALKLMGLEFHEAEIDTMLRGVNQAVYNYESLRKADVPLDTEPAFSFHPGLPDRQPIKGPQRFETTIAKTTILKAPSNLEELAFSRVVDLAPLVKSRAVSSTDLTKMYLARMKKYSPKLLCLITSTEEFALEQAAAADREIRAGHYRGPLHGIPFGLKDLFDTKGILTTFGAEPYQTRVADKDATVVERLHKAGAVLMAKLSMGALAQGGLWFNGMTKTPWNYEQTSSGSSAGSASSTAAGLVGFTLGTETLGSIISPSQACGTVGLRPTYGRISRFGAMALSWTMDKVGPICRGVEDCAIVLNAVYGPDGRDRTVGADPFHWEPRKPLAGMRIGILQKDFDRYTGEQKKVYDQALEDLKKAGVKMTPTEFVEDGPTIRFLLSAEAAAAFDDITRDGQVRNLRGQSPGDWPNQFRTSRMIPAVEYIRAQRARTQLIRKFEKFMDDWDVLVMPPNSLLTTTNLTGNPQVVMKCGFTEGAKSDGTKVQVPRSISFLGKIYDEGAPLRVALAYEQATEWHKQNPVLEV